MIGVTLQSTHLRDRLTGLSLCNEVAVLHYRKDAEIWTPRLFEQASDEVELSALGIALPLAEIYLDSGLLPG